AGSVVEPPAMRHNIRRELPITRRERVPGRGIACCIPVKTGQAIHTWPVIPVVAGRPFFSYQAGAVAPTILVFDSGLGGLTVFREVARALPHARYRYVADDAFFPYSSHSEAELVARVGKLIGELVEAHRLARVVVDC